MIKYPRKRNGSVDTGSPVKSSNSSTGSVCPKCYEHSILETVSAESCVLCGHIIFDYWKDAQTLTDMAPETPVYPF